MRKSLRIFLHFLALLPLITSCAKVGSSGLMARPSDKPIVPYIANADGVRAWLESALEKRYRLSAVPGSFVRGDGSIAPLRVAIYTVTANWVNQAMNSQELMMIEGEFIREITTESDGSVHDAEMIINNPLDYLLLIPFDEEKGTKPVPIEVQWPNPAILKAPISPTGIGAFENVSHSESRNVWTSPTSIRKLPRTGMGYTLVRNNALKPMSTSDLPTPNSRVDIDLMAAAMMTAIDPALRAKIVDVLDDLISKGKPDSSVYLDYWVINIVGYVVAADLIGYRTPAFENYLKNMSDVWTAPTYGWGDLTMRDLWKKAANQRIGIQAAVSLAAIDTYLGRKENVAQLVQEWTDLIENRSTLPLAKWSLNGWQANKTAPYYINPPGSVADCGGGVKIDVSNLVPNILTNILGPCKGGVPDQIQVKMAEAMVSFARIVERQGYSVWHRGNKAPLRIVETMRDRYGFNISLYPGLAWIYRIMDKRYGTALTCDLTSVPENVRWGAGMSTGWPWVESDFNQACLF